MAVSSVAQQAEINAFKKISKKLANSTAFAKPAGFEASFPDFGFRVNVGGKKVDLHIEFKADAKAQMGSMRDWTFNGTKFDTPSQGVEKRDLISIMNESPAAISNGKRLLKDLQKFADKRIKTISSGTMAIEPDKMLRYTKLKTFAENTMNYQIAKIGDASMGTKILNHYKKKFKQSQKNDADASALLMMIGDKLWLISSTTTYTPAINAHIASMLGGTTLPKMSGLQAQLEVRIQPRGLSGKGSKPVSIDVMASFRLSGGVLGGLQIK